MYLRNLTVIAAMLAFVLVLLTPVRLAWVFAGEGGAPGSPESVEERRLLYSLNQERIRLRTEYQERTQQLDRREIELKTLAGEVDKKLMEMQKLREIVQKLLTEKNTAEIKRVKRLSRMYAKMKPAKAARLLVDLEQDLAVAILTGMAPKSGAKIMNNMPAGTVVNLSLVYSSLEKN